MAHTKVTKNGTQNNGTANTFSYSGSFDVFKASEVEVELDNIALTFTTSTINESASPREYTVDYDNKTVHIGGANLASSNSVVIQPVTDMGAPTPRATYAPGSSVTSEDLNNNQLQLMRKAMEYNEQKLSSRGGTMTGNLHLGQNVDLSFEGDTDNTYETTLTVADPTADRTITFPDTTGTVVTTGDTGTVATGMIAADAVTGAKIADDQINSEHYVDGSIDTAHIGNAQVTADKLGNDSVTTTKIQNSAVTSAKIADDTIVNADINSSAAIANSKLANSSVTVGSTSIALGGTATDISGLNSVVSSEYSIHTEGQTNSITLKSGQILFEGSSADHYETSLQVTNPTGDRTITLPDTTGTVVTTGDTATVTATMLAANSVDSSELVDGSVDHSHLSNDCVDGDNIQDDSINSEHYVDGSIDTAHIGGSQVTDAKLASNSVTTSKITDANVTTIKIADNAVNMQKLGCQQTTLTDSDSHVPTSGAVVDYVAAQIAPIGGLEVIADEDNFPTSQPSSGVVISISDAAGIVVNGSGVSTTARTVGNGSDNVTINNFPSSLYNETLASGVGLMVSSTGSSNTYNYHKLLAAETDVKQLSDDINDFNARYRVGSSNPTSALDSGDLFFNTGSGKLLVYNGTQSAWEEAQSIGQYFINTLSSYSGTGGNSASFNGSAYRFVLSNAGAVAEQHIVSINGVIQKPNSGTSQPGEGFAIDGSSIIFSSAPATGADFFIITIGSTVNIGTPSDGTVTAAKLTSGAVTTAKIADDAVTEAKIADASVDEARLKISNSPTNGYFLSAQSGNTGGLTWAAVNTDLSNDSSPQLGGDLQSNGNDIDFADNDKAIFGDGGDLKIYHNGTDNYIMPSNGNLIINTGSADLAKFTSNAGVELYYSGTKKFETTSNGITISGNPTVNGTQNQNGHLKFPDHTGSQDAQAIFGNSDDLKIFHDGSDSKITDSGTGSLALGGSAVFIQNAAHDANMASFIAGAETNLFHNGDKKFETTSTGAKISGTGVTYLEINTTDGGVNPMVRQTNGDQTFDTGLRGDSSDAWCVYDVTNSDNRFMIDTSGNVSIPNDNAALKIGAGDDYQFYHDGSASYIKNTGNHSLIFMTNNGERWGIEGGGHFKPHANNAYDIGTSSYRVRNIYTNDLHLSNEGHSNDVDGTWGNWTIQEGESDLFLKNNRSGKKYKFNLTEVS